MCEKTVAEMIIENLAAEAEAQGKYQPLIDKLKGLGNFEAAAEIEEIVSDEKQHAMKLYAMLFDFDKIKIANDDMKDVLSVFEKNIK